MTVAQLLAILEHLPRDLPVHLPSGVECWEVRSVAQAPWTARQVVLDQHRVSRSVTVERVGLRGRFIDRPTLNVRLARLEET